MISIKYNTREESGKPSTYARLGDVPDGGGLHNVPDHKLPDRLQKKTSYKTQFEFWKILSSHLVLGDIEQLVQRTCLTWPLPCLFRPWFLLFEVIFCNQYPCLQRLNLSKFGRLSIATATWFSPITNQSENQDSCPRYPFQWPLPTWTKPLKNSRGGSWAINSSGIGINAWALGICACLL